MEAYKLNKVNSMQTGSFRQQKGEASSLGWLVFAGVCILILLAGSYFIFARPSTQALRSLEPSSSPLYQTDTQETKREPGQLIIDPVCKTMVNPLEAQYKYIFEPTGQVYFFCSKECYDRFMQNPFKYLPVKIKAKVKVVPNEEHLDTPTPEILEDTLPIEDPPEDTPPVGPIPDDILDSPPQGEPLNPPSDNTSPHSDHNEEPVEIRITPLN